MFKRIFVWMACGGERNTPNYKRSIFHYQWSQTQRIHAAILPFTLEAEWHILHRNRCCYFILRFHSRQHSCKVIVIRALYSYVFVDHFYWSSIPFSVFATLLCIQWVWVTQAKCCKGGGTYFDQRIEQDLKRKIPSSNHPISFLLCEICSKILKKMFPAEGGKSIGSLYLFWQWSWCRLSCGPPFPFRPITKWMRCVRVWL